MQFLKKYLLVPSILLLLSCSNKEVNHSVAIKRIVNSPEFNKIAHLDIEGRAPLYLIRNEHLPANFLTPEGGHPIKVVSDTTGTNENYVRFSKFKLSKNNDSLKFAIYYKIENVSFEGVLTKKNHDWAIQDCSIFQF